MKKENPFTFELRVNLLAVSWYFSKVQWLTKFVWASLAEDRAKEEELHYQMEKQEAG